MPDFPRARSLLPPLSFGWAGALLSFLRRTVARMPDIEKRPPAWPFCWFTQESKTLPGVIVAWERGYPPSPMEWSARIIFAGSDGKPMTAVVPEGRVTDSRAE